MTFKEYFFKESSNEVTKITSPKGSYKIKFDDGEVMRFKLGEDIHSPVQFAYIDNRGFAHSPDNDTPALVTHETHNNTIIKEWYNHGVKHREGDEPAEISKSASTGALTNIFYIKNGKKHRLVGPAIISYYNGDIDSEHYYINGINYTKEKFDEYTKGLESKEDKDLLGDLGQTFD